MRIIAMSNVASPRGESILSNGKGYDKFDSLVLHTDDYIDTVDMIEDFLSFLGKNLKKAIDHEPRFIKQILKTPQDYIEITKVNSSKVYFTVLGDIDYDMVVTNRGKGKWLKLEVIDI